MMFRTEIDLATGEERQVPLTPEEIAEIEAAEARLPNPAD